MSETTIVMRRATVTKGDVREHWKDRMGETVLAMLILLLAQLLLAAPAWIYDSAPLEILIQALGFSIFWLGVRLAYIIYKFVKV